MRFKNRKASSFERRRRYMNRWAKEAQAWEDFLWDDLQDHLEKELDNSISWAWEY